MFSHRENSQIDTKSSLSQQMIIHSKKTISEFLNNEFGFDSLIQTYHQVFIY